MSQDKGTPDSTRRNMLKRAAAAMAPVVIPPVTLFGCIVPYVQEDSEQFKAKLANNIRTAIYSGDLQASIDALSDIQYQNHATLQDIMLRIKEPVNKNPNVFLSAEPNKPRFLRKIEGQKRATDFRTAMGDNHPELAIASLYQAVSDDTFDVMLNDLRRSRSATLVQPSP